MFTNQDVVGLAYCLQRIIDEQSLRQHLIKNGKATADDIFTMDKTVSAYEQFYKETYQNLRSKWQETGIGKKVNGVYHQLYILHRIHEHCE